MIESFPREGPTERSSKIVNGAGNAPALRRTAKSLAVSNVKFPDICPLPPVIASLITGALITSPSNTIANLYPTFFDVRSQIFLNPLNQTLNLLLVDYIGPYLDLHPLIDLLKRLYAYK